MKPRPCKATLKSPALPGTPEPFATSTLKPVVFAAAGSVVTAASGTVVPDASTLVSSDGDDAGLVLSLLMSRKMKNPTRTAMTATTMLSVELKFWPAPFPPFCGRA